MTLYCLAVFVFSMICLMIGGIFIGMGDWDLGVKWTIAGGSLLILGIICLYHKL